ncbi:PIG-L deacetylase family protein [Gallaecimonas sp. GXIMD4217]|uniref:PIG-L deacetylase family protein n=1 Tax=Gallaecimonas sp. GXIMD4217 TaxID=3131927 RepID=UPI00311B29B3
MNKVLVVAAHPDDEVLGCGGTLAKHVAAGDSVEVLFMADGVGARSPDQQDQALASRNRAAEDAAARLGISRLHCLGLADNRLDGYPLLDLVQALEAKLAGIRPDIIYSHHHGDLNIDHRLTHQAVMTACRPLPGSSVKRLYAFEVQSSTEWALQGQGFVPNVFVDISDHLDVKLQALGCYQEEMRPSPHARSVEAVEALARWRGASVGQGPTEAFVLLRQCD